MLNEHEYNQYLKKHITHYIVSVFQGKGKYDKHKFIIFADAKAFYLVLKDKNPILQGAVYGISEPKDKPYPMNVIMEI